MRSGGSVLRLADTVGNQHTAGEPGCCVTVQSHERGARVAVFQSTRVRSVQTGGGEAVPEPTIPHFPEGLLRAQLPST